MKRAGDRSEFHLCALRVLGWIEGANRRLRILVRLRLDVFRRGRSMFGEPCSYGDLALLAGLGPGQRRRLYLGTAPPIHREVSRQIFCSGVPSGPATQLGHIAERIQHHRQARGYPESSRKTLAPDIELR